MQREDINSNFERIIESIKYILKGLTGVFLYLSHTYDHLEKDKTDLQKLEREFYLL